MLQRNWLQLDRKLVDKTDLEYTVDGMTKFVNEVSEAMWGPGILVTSQYPNPFALTLSALNLNITVGNGIGFDTTGEFTSINPSATTSNVIAGIIGEGQARWDLLVIEYTQIGDTLIPKPSDPLSSVDLNLHDDFTLRIIQGTPSGSPAYPAYTGPGFILMGLQVPIGATTSSQFALDPTVAQYSRFGFAQQPVFIQEPLTGLVNGINTVFTISQTPITSGSLKVLKTGVKCKLGEYTLVNKTITFSVAPAIGEDVWADYVANSPNSQNPVQGTTEAPTGLVNGSNRQFGLTQKPIYQSACDVYVDGRWIAPTQWALVSAQGGQSYILFNAGSSEIPATGESIEVQYWFNSWPNFLPPSGGGGGVSYVREVHGSFASPMSIDPTIGIAPTGADYQTWYMQPTVAGAQTISAVPSIAPGTKVGQILVLKGVSASNYLKISSASGTGVNQNGICNLTDNQCITYEWDGANWNEDDRRN